MKFIMSILNKIETLKKGENNIFSLYSGYEPKGLLSAGQIFSIIARLLVTINPKLGKLSWQTSYVATKIALYGKKLDTTSLRNILSVSLLHLSGFYHFIGESFFERTDFTHEEKYRAYTYTYYYLKEMTPFAKEAQAVLFYNKKYDSVLAKKIPDLELASLIFTSQSLAKMIEAKGASYDENDISAYGVSNYNPHYLEIFKAIDKERKISSSMQNGSFENELFKWFMSLKFDENETKILLRLLIYVMDFKSTQTVQHTIHAASFGVVLGKYAGCSEQELNELFTAGILHDLGKMAIPISILDSPKKHLPAWQYKIMKQHVVETERIIYGLVPDKIYYIAVRHHEKLDGSGYPNHLTAIDLTPQQRIFTIADILSALMDKRSYKESYTEEHIKAIIKENEDNGQIDPLFCKCIFNNYKDVQTGCVLMERGLVAPLGLVEIQFQEEMSNIQAI